MKAALFVLGTWGVILGLPALAFLLLAPHLGTTIAAAIGGVLFALGVFMGEWLARLMNRVL